MLLLILKSSACIAVFMLFYKLLLEKESFHHFKRFYLLGTIIVSILIPNFTISQYVEVNAVSQLTSISTLEENTTIQNYWLSNLTSILWSIYILGVILFSFRFLINLVQLFYKVKSNPKIKHQSFINVLLNDSLTPHTFFIYIFLNKKEYDRQQIPEEVLFHEQAHAEQKHSVDILIVEILQIIFWFNPLVYILKHYIKLNHEFLADKAVLSKGVEAKNYQETILAFSSNASQPKLANAINYSLIKKRFTIMKTQTSKQMVLVKSLALLPLLAVLIYSFSSRTTKNIEISEKEIIKQTYQQKATSKQLAEYNELARYYNSMEKSNMRVKMKDVERLKYLYGLMTESQKKSAETFPNFPPPPPSVPTTTKQFMLREVPPPPPIPQNATPKKIAEYKQVVKEHKAKQAESIAFKPAPLRIEVKKVPSSPNPPKNPLEHIKSMAKKGAIFSFEGNSITVEEAIRIIKKNERINISTTKSSSNKPKVLLSKKPIIIEIKE